MSNEPKTPILLNARPGETPHCSPTSTLHELRRNHFFQARMHFERFEILGWEKTVQFRVSMVHESVFPRSRAFKHECKTLDPPGSFWIYKKYENTAFLHFLFSNCRDPWFRGTFLILHLAWWHTQHLNGRGPYGRTNVSIPAKSLVSLRLCTWHAWVQALPGNSGLEGKSRRYLPHPTTPNIHELKGLFHLGLFQIFTWKMVVSLKIH